MKRKILSVATAAILAGSALHASDSAWTKALFISGDYGSMKVGNDSSSAYGGTFGLAVPIKDFMFGVKWQFLKASDDTVADSIASNAEIMFGYDIYKGLVPYAQVGYSGISDWAGLTYGAGIKYQIFSYVAIDAAYTTGKISPTNGLNVDLDYSTATIGLQFNFMEKR